MKSASFPAVVRRLLLAALACSCAMLVGLGPTARPAYAEDTVTEITLQTPGTPEAGRQSRHAGHVGPWTTDPGVPQPTIVLAHGFGGTQGRRRPDRAARWPGTATP